MSRQRVYLMGRQAIIPKLEGADRLPVYGKQKWTDRRVEQWAGERWRDIIGETEEFRVPAPYKGNLMGQLNRYHRRVHKWLFNF